MKTRFLILVSFLIASLSKAQIYESLPVSGEVLVTLHPGKSVNAGDTKLVAFGVPFPRSLVSDVSQISITNASNQEQASEITELLRWHSLSDNPNVGGVRSALVHVNVTFSTVVPITIKIKYGQSRTLELGPQGDVKSNWLIINDPDDEYDNSIEIKEPAVYATFSPEWMNRCVIRTKFIPFDQASSAYQWHSEGSVNFGESSFTTVPSVYTNEPWLFDRAGSFWNLYFRTGELKWLKASHRASQFYASNMNANGSFNYKPGDFKYSYGSSMLIDIMFTGDISLRDKITAVAKFQDEQNLLLQDGSRFWTERHYAYWLLGALSAFEATGDSRYRDKVNERAAHTFFRAKNPIRSYQSEGGLLHTMGSHELGGYLPGPIEDRFSQPIISPWMSALLADAIWRYYLHSEDNAALEFLIGLGENVARHCMYTVENVHTNINGKTFPYYMWSGQANPDFLHGAFFNPWEDDQHGIDVGGLLARAFWAQKKLGRDSSEITPQIEHMINAAKFDIDKQVNFRVNPPRKYNWQYGTTSDLEWLMTNVPERVVLSLDNITKEVFKPDFFRVFPNPTEGPLNIVIFDIKSAIKSIELFTVNGKLLKSFPIERENSKAKIDISNYHEGMYFVRVTSESRNTTFRIIKL